MKRLTGQFMDGLHQHLTPEHREALSVAIDKAPIRFLGAPENEV